jgi:hypothetical protein
MSGIFKPNFSILQDWAQTCTVAFQQLRRISFLTEEIFSFGEFNPQVTWAGTASAVTIFRARYLKIYKMLFFSIHIQATLAVPFTTTISVRLPYNAAGRIEGGSAWQGGGAVLFNAGTRESGAWAIQSGTDLLTFVRATAIAYTAGVAAVYANGFIEVE